MSSDTATDYIKELSFADPEIAKSVKEKIEQKRIRLSERQARMLYEEVAWALSLDYAFGNALVDGYLSLYETAGTEERVETYRKLVRKAGEDGPTYGRMLSEHIAPVLACGDEALFNSFMDAVDSMRRKGTYALNEPLRAVSTLLAQGDKKTPPLLLEILKDLYSLELTYGESRHYSHTLPKEVLSFVPSKREWQTEALRRIMLEDYRLADSFLEGMNKGLYFLSREALNRFLTAGIEKYSKERTLGARFISLESESGAEMLSKLQTTVPLSHVRLQLARYVKARIGRPVSVSTLSQMPGAKYREILAESHGVPFVFSDSKYLYLPDEISFFDSYEENRSLYKSLARLESGLYEFNTYGFDIEKAVKLIGALRGNPEFLKRYRDKFESGFQDRSDMERFFSFFPVPEIACDLFNIFEFGRIRVISSKKYPGLIRLSYPFLIREAENMHSKTKSDNPLFLLYALIALGETDLRFYAPDSETEEALIAIFGMFEKAVGMESIVETCAVLVFQTYDSVCGLLRKSLSEADNNSYKPLKMPFGRRLKPDLYFAANKKYEDAGRRIKADLQKNNISVFKSDIVSILEKNGGTLSDADLKEIIISYRNFLDSHGIKNQEMPPDLSLAVFSELDSRKDEAVYPEVTGASFFWYREWDANLCDYLNDHVRVMERKIDGIKGDFYSGALNCYRGTIKRMRREFELLRPEKIKNMRQWIEGDEFDYRSLIEFAVDRKAGLIPSDRLYIKKIKQHRDIAALLLIDLSRSTSGIVIEAGKSVHEIIKEATVLFCEALDVAGDRFSIAGFSGTGRLGVDYYAIKDFTEKMDDAIKKRINALSPQRRTRMGAAVRHAAHQLEKAPSKVRLLLIISDGFPNDNDYKQVYAIEDTRKAISEARSKKIYVRAITVDISPDSRLDDLYGHFHHNVISDVRRLPDRLLRIYGTMTRQ
jgi:hypothetical protein